MGRDHPQITPITQIQNCHNSASLSELNLRNRRNLRIVSARGGHGVPPPQPRYPSSITDRILPAGSLNHAICIPGSRMIPLSSVLRSGWLYFSSRTPSIVNSFTASSMSFTRKFRTVNDAGVWFGFEYMKTVLPPARLSSKPSEDSEILSPNI